MIPLKRFIVIKTYYRNFNISLNGIPIFGFKCKQKIKFKKGDILIFVCLDQNGETYFAEFNKYQLFPLTNKQIGWIGNKEYNCDQFLFKNVIKSKFKYGYTREGKYITGIREKYQHCCHIYKFNDEKEEINMSLIYDIYD